MSQKRVAWSISFIALSFLCVFPPDKINSNTPQYEGGEVLAQAFSPRCATPVGICFVQPQPIGSPCYCGQFQGTIIP
jgi:hypothetical protein